ncbi:MAG: homoserine dehydrogenase [Clostridia bacterium]|nr:homoserine dehydrogenase [Clostridia bacterium]
MTDKAFKIAVIGCGVVGSGVADILINESGKLSARFSRQVALKSILDIRDLTGTPYEQYAVKDPKNVLEDEEIDVAVVTVGGLDFAYSITKKALLAGKHVVTSNKDLVAEHGRELEGIAYDKGVRFLYEASVGGSVPIIRPLRICMGANVISGIMGVVNGTTNYMLTRMEEDGLSFDEALWEAQTRGYAEANPSSDVDGFDPARKIAILSSIAYGKFVDYKKIPTTGIRKITAGDIANAGALGGRIKLIARTALVNGAVTACVEPQLVMKSSFLCSVSGAYNGILIRGEYTGNTFFYGIGAGKLPTANAICGDIVELLIGAENDAVKPGFISNEAEIAPIGEPSRYYIRLDNIPDGEFKPGLEGLQMVSCGSTTAFVTGELTPEGLSETVDSLTKAFPGSTAGLILKIFNETV